MHAPESDFREALSDRDYNASLTGVNKRCPLTR